MKKRRKFTIHKKGALGLLELVEKHEEELKAEYNLNGIRGLITKLINLIKGRLIAGEKIYFPNLGDLEIKCKRVHVPTTFIDKPTVIPTLYLKFTTSKTLKRELNDDSNPHKTRLLQLKGCLQPNHSNTGGSHG